MSFRDDFLNYSGVEVEPVDTPAGPTFVRTMSAGQRDRFEVEFAEDKERRRVIYRGRLVMHTCCDAEGHLIFGPKDLARINDLSMDVVEPIFLAARKLNGLEPDEQELMRKNSPGREDGPDSSTDSPSP